MNTNLRYSRGVTLIELMSTVSILSMTLAFGVPSFDNLQSRTQRQYAASELKGAFSLARSEAGRRGSMVSVCASTDQTTCSTGTSTDWNSGWIVFADGDEDGIRDDAEELLYFVGFESPRFTLAPPSAIGSRVSFLGIGFPSATGNFQYADDTTTFTLALNFAGRLEYSSDQVH